MSAVVTYNVEQAQTHIADSVLAVEHCRNSECCINTGENTLAKVNNRNRNRIEGCALAGDNLCARLLNVILYLIVVEFGINNVCTLNTLSVFLDGNVGNITQ